MAQKTINVNEQVLDKIADDQGVNADAALQALVDEAGARHRARFIAIAWDGLSETDKLAALAGVNVDPFGV